MIVNDKDIKTLIGKDALFGEMFHRLNAPPNWIRSPGFAALSKIILEQQVSLASANAHFGKLKTFVRDLEPGNILKLSDEEMRACQISRQKMGYLRELSAALIAQPDFLDTLKVIGAEAARRRLTSVKGIGHWTTDVYLMFCLQDKDIFPVGDIAVVHTMRELTPARTKEDMLLLAEKWKPLRSLATYFLWHHYLIKRNRHVPASGYDTPVAAPDKKRKN